jgi:hypothetical protein
VALPFQALCLMFIVGCQFDERFPYERIEALAGQSLAFLRLKHEALLRLASDGPRDDRRVGQKATISSACSIRTYADALGLICREFMGPLVDAEPLLGPRRQSESSAGCGSPLPSSRSAEPTRSARADALFAAGDAYFVDVAGGVLIADETIGMSTAMHAHPPAFSEEALNNPTKKIYPPYRTDCGPPARLPGTVW